MSNSVAANQIDLTTNHFAIFPVFIYDSRRLNFFNDIRIEERSRSVEVFDIDINSLCSLFGKLKLTSYDYTKDINSLCSLFEKLTLIANNYDNDINSLCSVFEKLTLTSYDYTKDINSLCSLFEKLTITTNDYDNDINSLCSLFDNLTIRSNDYNNQEEKKNICRLCCDRKYCTIFIPCMHIYTCMECGIQLEDCPVCRTQISSVELCHLP